MPKKEMAKMAAAADAMAPYITKSVTDGSQESITSRASILVGCAAKPLAGLLGRLGWLGGSRLRLSCGSGSAGGLQHGWRVAAKTGR